MPAPIPRTTAALVMGIVTVGPGVDLTPFIAIANEITTDICGPSGYSDGFVGSRMELIERWLSAHYYTIYDNQLANIKGGAATVGLQYKINYGLRNSMYGQQAIRLDTALNLASYDNLANQKRLIKVKLGWLGRRRDLARDCGDVDFGGEWASLTVEQ